MGKCPFSLLQSLTLFVAYTKTMTEWRTMIGETFEICGESSKMLQRGLWAALMKEMPLKGNTIQPQGEEHGLGSQLCTKFSFT